MCCLQETRFLLNEFAWPELDPQQTTTSSCHKHQMWTTATIVNNTGVTPVAPLCTTPLMRCETKIQSRLLTPTPLHSPHPLFSTPFPLPLRSLSPIQNRRFPCFVLSFSSPWYVGICQPVHRIETELGLLSKWFKMEVKHPLYGLFKEAAGKWVRCLLSIPDHSPTLDGQKVLWRLAPQFLLSHKALRWDFRTGGPFPALPDHATSDTKITGQRKRRGWMNQDITSRKKGGIHIFGV